MLTFISVCAKSSNSDLLFWSVNTFFHSSFLFTFKDCKTSNILIIYLSNHRVSSLQSSKKTYPPLLPLIEYKVSLPPKNQLLLKKRLDINKANTQPKKRDMQHSQILLQTEETPKKKTICCSYEFRMFIYSWIAIFRLFKR